MDRAAYLAKRKVLIDPAVPDQSMARLKWRLRYWAPRPLRNARLAKQLEVAAVARFMKVPADQLEGMEANDLMAYNEAWARAYGYTRKPVPDWGRDDRLRYLGALHMADLTRFTVRRVAS